MEDQTPKLIRYLQRTYGRPNPKRALSPSEVTAGLTVISLNAAALLEDARSLSGAKRHARAGSLVVLALEELAKVPALFGVAVAERAGDQPSWPDFWSGYAKHTTKQGNIAAYGRSLRTAGAFANDGPYAHYLPDDLGRVLDIYKQRNFYVDFDEDGFVLPGTAEVVAATSVDQLLVLAEERSDSFARLHWTESRSRILYEWACRNVTLARTGATAVPALTAAELMDPALPEDVRLELHSLVAHRSSAMIPDYLTVYGIGANIAELTTQEIFQQAVQDEADVLGRRMQLAAVLPASAARAYAMFKLLYGLVDRLGIQPPSLPQPPDSDPPRLGEQA